MLHPTLRFGSGMAPPLSNRGSTEIEMKKRNESTQEYRREHEQMHRERKCGPTLLEPGTLDPGGVAGRGPTGWVAAAPARAFGRVASFHSRHSIGRPIRVRRALGWAATGDPLPRSPLHLPPRPGTRGPQGGGWGSSLDRGSRRSTSLRKDREI